MDRYRNVKIGDVCTIEKGITGLAQAIPGNYPLVTTGADRKTSKDYQFDAKAVCMPLVSSTGHGKKTLNYVHYQEGKFALGSILAAVVPRDETILDARYLHLYLQKNKDRFIVPLMKGAANVSLSVTAISNIQFPLPPLIEQKKILNKMDGISNEHRDLFNESAIQIDCLGKLRQAILQEAIEGKLTAGWRQQNLDLISGNNHASKLLESIKTEKQRLIREGKIKKDKPPSPIATDEKPFDLPAGWVWCSLGEISINKDEYRKPIAQSIRQSKGKIYDYYGASGIIDKIDGYTHEGKNLLIGEDGANLVARSTPVAFIADGKYWVNNHAHVLGYLDAATLIFIKNYINAIDLKPYITGGFQPKLNQANLLVISVPLPPLAEQLAIVQKVDQLMAVIDDLEHQVTERKEQSKLLMQSVLREAFAG